MSVTRSFAIRTPGRFGHHALTTPADWLILLLATPFLGLSYLLLPNDELAHAIVYPLYGLLAVVAILVGIQRRRPIRRESWLLMAGGVGLLSAADVVYSALVFAGGTIPYPSIADAGYLAGFAFLIAGMLGLIRGRVTGGDRTAIIDAAILAAGAGSAFWVFIIQPTLKGAVDPLAATVSLGYPTMDLILLTLCLRVLFTSAGRMRYLQFLAAGIALYFVADIVYALAVLGGTYVEGQLVDLGWIIGVLLIGVAALHPSVATAIPAARASDTQLGRTRLALLAAAAVVAPIILIVREIQAADDSVAVGLILEWTVLFGLVLTRLAVTVHELGVSLEQRRRLQVDLAHQAHHDPLTGLANRLLFELRLGEAMSGTPQETSLIFLDIDDFKTINDTLGHGAGDELLQLVAERLRGGLRTSDLAARLGGDEFAIIVEGCADATLAHGVAERAIATIRAPFAVGARMLSIRASAGVATGRVESTAASLMRDADVAMYAAKSNGKDQVEQFEEGMHGPVIRSYQLRTELVEAIRADEFVLQYQPAIHLSTGMVVGAEALVRWNHPKRGLLGPDQFIPEAEASGQIIGLGQWILRNACITAAGWPKRRDGERPAVSVNLAASQLLQPGLVAEVAAILAETGLPARKLILEVTESALVHLAPAREALLGLRALGVLTALDDFGTGYSSLSYLADLPFDIVKIDRSFIAAIGKGSHVDALLDGIVGLCNALDLVIVAEGIETAAQLGRLIGLGCPVGQGYLFARPLPADVFVEQIGQLQSVVAATVPATTGAQHVVRRDLLVAI
jgi:diguanylate cyclase (GGDEF)-like protein